MWDLVVLIPDHCLSNYFKTANNDITRCVCGCGGWVRRGLWLNRLIVDQPSPLVLLWLIRHLVVRFAWKIPSSRV